MSEPTATDAVYVVLRKDFDHHTDRKGHLALPVGVYRTAVHANAAAEAHCTVQARRAASFEREEPEHRERGGLYWGRCDTREDRRDHFEVWVKMMKLGDAGCGSAAASSKKKRKSVAAADDAGGEGKVTASKVVKSAAGKRGDGD
ncbi:hypothetical protein DL764_003489 [Monosporascus ibericus]|uniref:Uncharacterized protein n=1 Tax=Monosporascus ibericus TaxID=155417 RepID=A0A4Q4TGE3_9PEZI|nr:hypothetical protein DL764_003489 [Monosporascus ibericus]